MIIFSHRSSLGSRRRSLVTAFFVAALMFFPLSEARGNPDNSSLRLAIIPGEGVRKVKDTIVAKMEVQLSLLEGIELVERTRIDLVLEELELSAFDRLDSRSALQLGQLLGADMLLYLEQIPDDELRVSRIQFVETKTGVVLRSLIEEEKVLLEDLSPIIQALELVKQTTETPVENRYYLGILGVRSAVPGTALDGQVEAINMFLAHDLSRSPQVIVLDREHLQYHQDEKKLTGEDLKIRSSLIIVEGELNYSGSPNDLKATMTLRWIGSGQRKTIAVDLLGDDLIRSRDRLTAEIVEELHLPAWSWSAFAPKKEAKHFLKQVPLHLASGDYETAVRHAEVAFALMPNQETRLWVARAWHTLGWSLAGVMSNSWTACRRVATPTLVAVYVNDPNADKVRAENKRKMDEFRRSGRDAMEIVAECKHNPKMRRGLTALVRSYTIFYELSRIHAQKVEQGEERKIEIPNPTNYKKTAHAFSYKEDLPSLNFRIPEFELVATKLYEQLKQIREEVYAFQLSYYDEKGRGEKESSFFWKGLDQLKQLAKMHKRSPQQKVKVLRKAVEKYVEKKNSEAEKHARGVLKVVGIDSIYELPEIEREFYQEMRWHEDPFIRLIALRQLVWIDQDVAAKELLETFVEHFPASHPYHAFKDRTLLPAIVYPAVDALSAADPEFMVSEVGQIVKPIIAKKDTGRLILWGKIFWAYMNGLNKTGRQEEAKQIARQVQAMVKWYFSPTLILETQKFKAHLDYQLKDLGLKRKVSGSSRKVLNEYVEKNYYANDPYYYIGVHCDVAPPGTDCPDMSHIPRGKGNVFGQGWERFVDEQGNELYKVYKKNAKVDVAAQSKRTRLAPGERRNYLRALYNIRKAIKEGQYQKAYDDAHGILRNIEKKYPGEKEVLKETYSYLAKVSRILGKTDEARKYAGKAAKIKVTKKLRY